MFKQCFKAYSHWRYGHPMFEFEDMFTPGWWHLYNMFVLKLIKFVPILKMKEIWNGLLQNSWKWSKIVQNSTELTMMFQKGLKLNGKLFNISKLKLLKPLKQF